MKTQDLTTVTYYFADNTKSVSQINKSVLFNEKNKARSIGEINHVFDTTAWDKRAIGYSLDGNIDESKSFFSVKEQYYTSKERYNAKRDYKEFKKNNPQAFQKENSLLVKQLTDGLAKKLRFNLKSITQLN